MMVDEFVARRSGETAPVEGASFSRLERRAARRTGTRVQGGSPGPLGFLQRGGDRSTTGGEATSGSHRQQDKSQRARAGGRRSGRKPWHPSWGGGSAYSTQRPTGPVGRSGQAPDTREDSHADTPF